MPLSPALVAGAAATAFIGGAINSIAGGGTLVTFPSLVALGVPPLVANTTNTMALWPGAVGSLWGYRGRLAGMRPWLVRFSIPSALGGLTGGWLLLAAGSDRFDAIVPYLVLGATLLFLANGPLGRWLRARSGGDHGLPHTGVAFFLAQFGVGVYGGYFGAGIGILMLAVLGLSGLADIHQMNGVKAWGAMLINVVAAVLFAARGAVVWPLAAIMAAGAIAGGYGGSIIAQRVTPALVRATVVAIGFGTFIWLLLRR
ncbi:MAG: sulfite exporter TauE/SafE family protein [Gemmatimonadales bacterium]